MIQSFIDKLTRNHPGIERIRGRTSWLSKFSDSSKTPVMPGKFADLFADHRGRVAHKWIHYFAIYDQLFRRIVDGFELPDGSKRPLHFLEIGVDQGGSLEIWREYFGPDAVIFGVDINPDCKIDDRDDLQVRIGSQSDPVFMKSVVREMGGVDVIVDDGSHVAKDQRSSFDTLFPLLSERGLYVIEDTHTAYHLYWGGGYRRTGTVIEVAKGMVDGLHRAYFRVPLGRRARLASSNIASIQFFDSIIAIDKQIRQPTEIRRSGTTTRRDDICS